MKKLILALLLTLSFTVADAQVTLSTNFFDAAYKEQVLYDAWQVANDISPTYEEIRDEPQIRPDLKMNIIRLSGGIKTNGQKDTAYDMVRWSNAVNDYVYDFTRLLRVIDKADEYSDEIYQLVVDNVPWCFQRGYTFVDLGKNSFDGAHFLLLLVSYLNTATNISGQNPTVEDFGMADPHIYLFND